MSAAPAAAWFPDPSDPTHLRWWDGAQWTEHRHPAAPPVAPVEQVAVQPQVIVMPAMMGAAQPVHSAPAAAPSPQLAQQHLELQRESLELQRAQMAHARERDERFDRESSLRDKIGMFWTGLGLLRMLRIGR